MSKVVRLTNATLDVLEALAGDGKVYGLQISARVKRPTGTVYPLLARLESLGWLEASWESDSHRGRGPRRRYYQLTSTGREEAEVALRRRDPAVSPLASEPPIVAASPEPRPGSKVTSEQVIRAFAAALRALRASAGTLSLRAISSRAGYSPAAISDALSGRSLPSPQLVVAIVRACGGDQHEWRRRRLLADQSIRHATWIPHLYEEFYPLGREWIIRRVRLTGLTADDEADIAQDVLLAAYQLWRDLSLVADLREWVRCLTDRLTAKTTSARDRPVRLAEAYQSDSRDHTDVAETVVARMSAIDLLSGLDLPTAQMAYLRGAGYELREVAEILETSRAAVENRLRGARRKIGAGTATQGREQYTAYLLHLRAEAGTPPLRTIAAQIRYSHTYIASVLSGAQIPAWEFTERFVQALGGSLDTARHVWLNATARDPHPADDWVKAAVRTGDMFTLWKLADRFERQGQTEQAARVWRIAAELGNPDAMIVMAELLDRQGDLDEAEHWLRHAVEAGAPEAKPLLTWLLERTGQVDEALDLWRHDTSPDAIHRLTRILERAGRVDEALAVWRWTADGHNSATRELAGLLDRHGRTNEAIQLWETAAEAGTFWALREMAAYIRRIREDRPARDHLRQILRSWRPEAQRELATILYHMGQEDEANNIWRGSILADTLPLTPEPGEAIAQETAQTTAQRYALTQEQIVSRLIQSPQPRDSLINLHPSETQTTDLIETLIAHGDERELHSLANSGDYRAARRLAEHLTDQGRTAEAITVLSAPAASGNSDAAWRLAQLLANDGKLNELRTMADNGSDYAGWLLVTKLTDAEDWPQLRLLAKAKGPYTPYATEQLTAREQEISTNSPAELPDSSTT
ncbi:hypothetical protein GCM10009555_015570 [Acrocarpospora macrocephala]|uniref:HTH cro/C1-type domain-containing protein n=1 Tax=Acrocarpospora macrocephala TaxID=150177 RepID=A0A5M3X7N2_9ACTN|nr:helix-turn-helix domain-containing protein [Acrocarpospora macrocephala]GES14198.1 hypothetical protein Amac_077950 [Acrocarpospora macrocephala]